MTMQRIEDDYGNSSYEPYKKFTPPANDHEALNDPKVKAKADFIVEWENVPNRTMDELTTEPSLVAHVDEFIKRYQLI
jgi:hypothetical protein